MEIYDYTVEKEESGIRIDRYLAEKDSGLSRSFIQKLLKDGQITVGDKAAKSNYKVRENDRIHLEIPDSSEPDIVPEDIPLDILYEDEDVLIVNKPKGMVVHPAAGHYQGTLVNAVMAHCGDSLSGINGVMRPGIVHRIDKDTTGALLVCKNDTDGPPGSGRTAEMPQYPETLSCSCTGKSERGRGNHRRSYRTSSNRS